jgi:hypothetical protein
MLAFYPEFDVDSANGADAEIIFVLDASCSMENADTFSDAKKLCMLALQVHIKIRLTGLFCNVALFSLKCLIKLSFAATLHC